MKPYYEHAGITIYHGDCREVLPSLEADVLITDPPYGVGFLGKVTKHTDRRGEMEAYVDSQEYFRDAVLAAVSLGLSVCKRAAIFTGTRRLQEYPAANDIGGIVCPNGAGRSSWGFGCFHPIAFYGSSPYIQSGQGARPTARAIYHPGMHVTNEQFGHPCPKPIEFMVWVVEIASLEDELILDPFMGSGTTLRAAKDLGRRAIGIEIEEKYCEIAAKRMGQEVFEFQLRGEEGENHVSNRTSNHSGK